MRAPSRRAGSWGQGTGKRGVRTPPEAPTLSTFALVVVVEAAAAAAAAVVVVEAAAAAAAVVVVVE